MRCQLTPACPAPPVRRPFLSLPPGDLSPLPEPGWPPPSPKVFLCPISRAPLAPAPAWPPWPSQLSECPTISQGSANGQGKHPWSLLASRPAPALRGQLATPLSPYPGSSRQSRDAAAPGLQRLHSFPAASPPSAPLQARMPCNLYTVHLTFTFCPPLPFYLCKHHFLCLDALPSLFF